MAIDGPLGRWSRWLALVLVILFAGLALGSAADRLSESNLAIANNIPPDLAAQAERTKAMDFLARGDSDGALAHAAAAVRADPFNRNSAGLLGTARYLSGDFAGAQAAFAASAVFGWRDPATQLFLQQEALRHGDLDEAVQRTDAILRQDPFSELAPVLLEPIEAQAQAQGRMALARRSAARPPWLRRYLHPSRDKTDLVLAHRVNVLELVANQGVVLGCEGTAGFVRMLIERGSRDEARRLWLAHCPDFSPSDGLADGSFEQLAQGSSNPFGWRSHRSGAVGLTVIDTGDGSSAISVQNVSSTSRLVLSQTLSLEAGDYIVEAEVSLGTEPVPGRVAVSLDCGGSPSLPRNVQGDLVDGGQRLTVHDCASQVIGLWARPGEGRIIVGKVELRPAS